MSPMLYLFIGVEMIILSRTGALNWFSVVGVSFKHLEVTEIVLESDVRFIRMSSFFHGYWFPSKGHLLLGPKRHFVGVFEKIQIFHEFHHETDHLAPLATRRRYHGAHMCSPGCHGHVSCAMLPQHVVLCPRCFPVVPILFLRAQSSNGRSVRCAAHHVGQAIQSLWQSKDRDKLS